MTTDTARASLVRRIKAILSKTIENGATEAEAFSALAKAQEMMRAHGLDRDAIDAEAFVREKFKGSAIRPTNWTRALCGGVGAFTGSFAFYPGGEANTAQFEGRESDVFFAVWLIDSLDAFVNRQAMAYVSNVGGARVRDGKRLERAAGQSDLFGGSAPVVRCRSVSTPWERQKIMQEFGEGVCLRISQRLHEMADADANRRAQAAKQLLMNQGMTFTKSRSTKTTLTDHGVAGMAAGDNAAFNKPLGGGVSSASLALARA
jgi:hypothetical protein